MDHLQAIVLGHTKVTHLRSTIHLSCRARRLLGNVDCDGTGCQVVKA